MAGCLTCQSFHNVAPLMVAVQVEVILTRRVKGHGPHLDMGVTLPADTPHKQNHPER